MTAAAANGRPQPGGRPSPDSLPAGHELRLLIREVLTDVLPALRGRLAAASGLAAVPDTPLGSPVVPDTLGSPAATEAVPDVPPTAIPSGAVDDADAPPGTSGRPAQPPRPATSPADSAAAPAPSASMRGLMFTGEHQTADRSRGDGAAARYAGGASGRDVTASVAGGRGAAVRQVRLETDEDVRQFALDIVRLADNPARRADLIAGRLTFILAGSPVAAARPEHRVDAGAVTERAVQAAAKAGQRLVLGPRAMLTPLARDRALALGVPIEKER